MPEDQGLLPGADKFRADRRNQRVRSQIMDTKEIRDERFEVHSTVSDHFAWLRTRLSIERTLMSWNRTAAALIGFGFTIDQVVERLQLRSPDKPVLVPEAPRYLGLALIGAGILGLVIALREYRFVINYIWSDDFRLIAGDGVKPHWTPLFTMSVLLVFVGVTAFLMALFRLS